ncbi:MAG: LysM peptidoglycan-binding domain-containing protein, partial [Bacteroidetes bacterium]|nr:LysM peptidoglycan-binding domain-containing protein [Bacteroidota bacterium]
QNLEIIGRVVPVTQSTSPAPTVKYYTVKRGDTFGVIASRNGMTITQLRKLNPRVNISRLEVGQRLRTK